MGDRIGRIGLRNEITDNAIGGKEHAIGATPNRIAVNGVTLEEINLAVVIGSGDGAGELQPLTFGNTESAAVRKGLLKRNGIETEIGGAGGLRIRIAAGAYDNTVDDAVLNGGCLGIPTVEPERRPANLCLDELAANYVAFGGNLEG